MPPYPPVSLIHQLRPSAFWHNKKEGFTLLNSTHTKDPIDWWKPDCRFPYSLIIRKPNMIQWRVFRRHTSISVRTFFMVVALLFSAFGGREISNETGGAEGLSWFPIWGSVSMAFSLLLALVHRATSITRASAAVLTSGWSSISWSSSIGFRRHGWSWILTSSNSGQAVGQILPRVIALSFILLITLSKCK